MRKVVPLFDDLFLCSNLLHLNGSISMNKSQSFQGFRNQSKALVVSFLLHCLLDSFQRNRRIWTKDIGNHLTLKSFTAIIINWMFVTNCDFNASRLFVLLLKLLDSSSAYVERYSNLFNSDWAPFAWKKFYKLLLHCLINPPISGSFILFVIITL